MLIVGLPAKLSRRRHENRRADSWWVHLSPVISQLYDAGGYDLLVDTAIVEEKPWPPGTAEGWVTLVRITCRVVHEKKDGYDEPTARLWIADDMLRGTLRLPALPLLQDWPDTIEGFLAAHDSSCADPKASPSLPYLVWKGTR